MPAAYLKLNVLNTQEVYPSKALYFIQPMKYLALLFVTGTLIISGAGCAADVPDSQNINYTEDVLPLIEETKPTVAVRGSCNVIAASSHCEDYIGSMWTEEQMKLQCEGTGTWSADACPYSDNGGCRVGKETIVENILWSYPYGGSPMTGEELGYEIQACEALEPTAWVMPDDLLRE